MSIPRSQSVPHVSSLRITTDVPRASQRDSARPKLPRHRSAVAVAGSSQPLASLYTPRSEREDPFSLGGFFPANLGAFENSPEEHEWDWLHASDDRAVLRSPARSGLVSPISEDDEWDIPTPCSAFADAGDALTRDAIKREDKLGILALSGKSRLRLLAFVMDGKLNADMILGDPADKLTLPSHGDELYVEDRLLSPYTQPGDPLDDEAVYDALRALRTAHSRPRGSAVKHEAAGMHELFSPEKEADDKMKVEADGWGARLVSWGVSRVADYISPV
ncbi:hypothetical protein OH77DRAFT_1516283 [Trametes cingulata]|nr:hypothetical protein OH77DRAFT_1516283 [Trametes cingulata]